MLAGLGDTPAHVKSNTFPPMASIQNDLGAYVLGLTTVTGTNSGADAWNASTAQGCWNTGSDGAAANDETYITDMINSTCQPPVGVSGHLNCDPNRIWMWGHSCGSFMALRYACDHSQTIAGVFSMSAFMPNANGTADPACTGTGHFHLAHFHGTSDSLVYDNSAAANMFTYSTAPYVSVSTDYSGRLSTVTQVSTLNGCSGSYSLTTSGWIDFDSAVAGNETDLYTFSGCPADGTVQVWKGNGSVHVPTMTTAGYNQMVSWFKNTAVK